MAANPKELFYEVLTDAINDLIENGFDSQERLDAWAKRLEKTARSALVPEATLVNALKDALQRVYLRAISGDKLLRTHSGISAYTLASIKPKLRAELDRRILASANLIKLNRQASIQRTLQRFSGWATSIPVGGTKIADRKKIKFKIRRGIAALPFEERRVIIDQGYKLTSAVNDIVAVDGGAIAAIWRHVHIGGGYQARPEHEERDGKLFVVRNNWALAKGWMQRSGEKYTDEIEQPGEYVYCRCTYQYMYALRDLPPQMLTLKGKQALIDARARIKGWQKAHHMQI